MNSCRSISPSSTRALNYTSSPKQEEKANRKSSPSDEDKRSVNPVCFWPSEDKVPRELEIEEWGKVVNPG